MSNAVMRYNKVAFLGVPKELGTEVTYTRMHGFTDMSESKNAITYERRYVDRKTSDTDVTGFAPSISFGFDEYTDDAVSKDIVGIIENEKIGTDAVRSIVVVDFSKTDSDGKYNAYERKWSIVGDTQGDGTDAFKYSGTMYSKSEKVLGKAVVATPTGGDNESAETITFTADSGE